MRLDMFNHILASFLLAGLAITPASGQERTQGSALLVYKDPSVGDGGTLSIGAGSSVLEWSLLHGPGFPSGGSVECPMPFSVAGGLAATGARTFIASGIDANGQGVLVRFSLTSPWTLNAQVLIDEVMPIGVSIDPQSVYWSETDSGLYILDGSANLVLYAPYAGGGTSLPSLGTYVQAASLVAPIPDNFLLTAPMSGELAGVAVFDPNQSPEYLPKKYLHVFPQTGGWGKQLKTRPVFTPQDTEGWLIRSPSYVSAGGPLRILGRIAPYSVVEAVSGVAVASGTTSSAELEHQVALPPGGLVPGLWYSVLTPADPDGGLSKSAAFLPHVRYGTPTETSQARLLRGVSAEARVGDDTFFLADIVQWQDGFQSPITVDVYLWIAFRDANGQDPVVPIGGGVYLLDANQLFGSTGPQQVSIEDRHGAFLFPLPIPGDDVLVGNTILFQYAAVAPPNDQVIVSDVFGVTMISGGGGGAARGGQALRSSGSRVTPSAESLRAASGWMTAASLGVSVQERVRIKQLQDALRHQ